MEDPHNKDDSSAKPSPFHEPGPRVIDLSHQNSHPKNFFHKKAFIGGLIVVVILSVIGLALGFYYIRQRITVPPQATEAELEAQEELDPGNGMVEPQQPLSEEEG